ncbi:MAG: hypothetical protein K2L67_05900 [Clostridia bacterium]|nr:hypothetical protein [Clostridia bacterium]
MGGYVKNIAVIKGLKDGFSVDGGPLSGLVKCERYGSVLRVEVTYLNFAPLSEGRYVTAISDGNSTLIVENGTFEGSSPIDTSEGFAALVCYINGGVFPVASAVCGNFHGAALGIKEEVEKVERAAPECVEKTEKKTDKKNEKTPVTPYEDEAIAEVNYYEFAQVDKGGGALRQNKEEEKDGAEACENEAAFGAFEKGQSGVNGGYDGGNRQKNGKNGASPLSRGGFYERVKDEVEGLLRVYPKEEALEKTVENSKWVRITYDGDKFYVFGVIYGGQSPEYICYGVPTEQSEAPPESMRGLASFIPLSPDERHRGYFIMYQDAQTGASLKIDLE